MAKSVRSERLRAAPNPCGQIRVNCASAPPRLPPFTPGQRIGLYGGSFNPPHAGHKLVCEIALRRLRLDQLWILPTIGNPLKDVRDLAPLEIRARALSALITDRRVKICDLEAHTHTRYTIDTLRFIVTRGRGGRFVWLMGADNLIQFSQWRKWRDIADLLPIAVIDRPGATLRAGASKTARALARFRQCESQACAIMNVRPPALVFLHDRRSPLASSFLRAKSQP